MLIEAPTISEARVSQWSLAGVGGVGGGSGGGAGRGVGVCGGNKWLFPAGMTPAHQAA